MRDKLSSVKERVSPVANHVYRNRGRYAFTAGAVAATYVLGKRDRVAEWNQFLEEKGLTDEFYALGQE